MDIDIQRLADLVRTEARDVLLPQFNTVTRQYKTDGSVVTAADHAMQKRLTEALLQLCPHVKLLGEEMTSQQQRQLLDSSEDLWCLDPVDGTSNFAAGMPYFSVSLALLRRGEAVLGVVYDPILDECFYAEKDRGAWLNAQPLKAQETGLNLYRTLAMVDFKRLPVALTTRLVHDLPYGSQRSLGSIALELCWIAAGRAHIYLHGKQHLWDYAAAQLILKESGAYVATLEGHDLLPNTLEPQSAYAAVDSSLFQAWRHYLQHRS